MNKLSRKFYLCLVLLPSFLGYSYGKEVKEKKLRPNIIYILTDDLGYGDLSCLNDSSKLYTKNMDALSRQGMIFTDAHSNSSVSTPTRYGILTGRYAWRSRLKSGVLNGYSDPLIEEGRMTLASLMKGQNYNTACIGKWHLGIGWAKDASGKPDITKPIVNDPVNYGFDYYYGIAASLDMPPYVYIENRGITATRIDSTAGSSKKKMWRKGLIGNDFKHIEVLPKFTEKAVSYIKEESKKDKPFFLYLPLPAPHTPILPTEEFQGKSHTNEYGDFVLMVDDAVGKIMKAVEEAGIDNNTIIVLTSDNGCSTAADFAELKTYGHNPSYIFRGNKADVYEGGHRIPFIVKWPAQVKAASVSGQTVCLTDFMATCAEILGTTLPDNAGEDSNSLLPILQGKDNKVPVREAIVHHSINGSFSIRQGKWKLEFCAGSGGWSYPKPNDPVIKTLPPFQLYDLDKDKAEKNNVVDQNPEIVSRLTKLMEKYIEDGRSTPGARQLNRGKVLLVPGSKSSDGHE